MAMKAFVREDRTNVTVEDDLLSGGGEKRQGERQQQAEAHGDLSYG
jgi:hypothetical protein